MPLLLHTLRKLSTSSIARLLTTSPPHYRNMSTTTTSPFSTYTITPSTLSAALTSPPPPSTTRIIPLCSTWFLPNSPHSSTQTYRHSRIPSSRFFDLDAVKDPHSPYPHMLPPPQHFSAAMRELRIRRSDTVVVYDSAELGLFSAPRVGWTFRVMGHERVHVLDNFKRWVEGGYAVESGEPAPVAKEEVEESGYPVPDVELGGKVVGFGEMKELVQKGGGQVQILDARPYGRWAGTAPEPRPGLESGHMPGSISVPHSELLDPKSGTLLPREELRRVFEKKGVDFEKPVVSSCGTGVTAAVVDMALEVAEVGRHGRRVYDGSWTEWAQRVKEDEGLIEKEG
ncbi:hypothetical protein ACLMJK_006250 [Lecanora helva]